MIRKPFLILMITVSLVSVLSSTNQALMASADIMAGRVVLTQSVQLGDQTLSRGTYNIRLTPRDEGMFIQFLRQNQVIAEDLLIERPARSSRSHPSVSIGKVWNQNFLKLTVHLENTLYLCFLPLQ